MKNYCYNIKTLMPQTTNKKSLKNSNKDKTIFTSFQATNKNKYNKPTKFISLKILSRFSSMWGRTEEKEKIIKKIKTVKPPINKKIKKIKKINFTEEITKEHHKELMKMRSNSNFNDFIKNNMYV